MEMGNSLYKNNAIPTPNGFVAAKNIKNGMYVYGNDGNPVKVKMVVTDNVDQKLYNLCFKERMNMITPLSQSFMTFSPIDNSMKTVTVEEMKKVGPVGPAASEYRFTIPTSPAINEFGISDLSPQERVNIIDQSENYLNDIVLGTLDQRIDTVKEIFKNGDFVTDNKHILYTIGILVRSVGYTFHVNSKQNMFTLSMDNSFLAARDTTVSGIEEIKEKSNNIELIGISVDNKDNMFIGPNFTLMYGYNV